MRMNEPLLSVCLITYNHSKYIKDAIEGVLMQKVNFSWELIIADDFSTDGTREIVLEYKDKYPEFIKLILQEKNVGPAQNWVDLITFPISKYIAYLEGDDYWINPAKLQMQVDFLESNPAFSLCFHDAIILWDDKTQPPELFCDINQKQISTISDVVQNWFIPSVSLVFRQEYIIYLPNWIMKVYNGDYALHLLLADKGNIYYFNKIMAVYRKNNNALSGGIGKNSMYVNNEIKQLLNYFDYETGNRFHSLILKRIRSIDSQIELSVLKIKHPILYHMKKPVLTLGKLLRNTGNYIISRGRLN